MGNPNGAGLNANDMYHVLVFSAAMLALGRSAAKSKDFVYIKNPLLLKFLLLGRLEPNRVSLRSVVWQLPSLFGV